MKYPLSAMTVAVAIAAAGSATARDQIKIVGSSTVFPFSTAVAESYGRATGNPTPVVEATGSGGGIKLFCQGVGTDTPDITNASRRMKASEFEKCVGNGVTDIIEVEIGFDGIVVANAKDAPDFDLNRAILYKALVKSDDMPTMWNQIDPSLPAARIEVLGPPPSSGTRDAFEELALEAGCEEAGMAEDVCKNIEIRDDGAWVDAGENDNLIVSKLESNQNAVGVFGFSFLDQNADRMKGATMGGVEPTFENIASGEYPVSRSLYFYIKKAHVDVVPGIMEYAAEFVSIEATGAEGYLTEKGLIPLSDDRHSANAENVLSGTALTEADLK